MGPGAAVAEMAIGTAPAAAEITTNVVSNAAEAGAQAAATAATEAEAVAAEGLVVGAESALATGGPDEAMGVIARLPIEPQISSANTNAGNDGVDPNAEILEEKEQAGAKDETASENVSSDKSEELKPEDQASKEDIQAQELRNQVAEIADLVRQQAESINKLNETISSQAEAMQNLMKVAESTQLLLGAFIAQQVEKDPKKKEALWLTILKLLPIALGMQVAESLGLKI
jgi:hypothetical protein